MHFTQQLRRGTAVTAILTLMLSLAACLPEPSETTTTPTAATETPSVTHSATPTPSPSVTAVSLPTDCRAILTQSVLDELGQTPLNDPAAGVSTGVQADGSLVCLWRDTAADTTYLQTTVSAMNRGPALDLMNELRTDDGFSCYTPDDGTRCEKVWMNDTYPVNDGRTLFWRDDILIDTQYSNLAPSGYTDAVISGVFG
ncbi:hypothetical protein FHX49_000979 [Microbacterium endophyticum]|uniref:DUF3558 domain-containing protein n=1 Tax=Microbacterium endophyticum TaxID=1526412 RepID=A0A7W4YLQ2_9MICO|nr:hypothetical protein [Microbacterium endophyticum]MBB2975413.1 hypothetical protein [Microbacterium endophyticum]NIK35568.1 hypothetical protein [Microbacterium endophyticum]